LCYRCNYAAKAISLSVRELDLHLCVGLTLILFLREIHRHPLLIYFANILALYSKGV